jgi:hypothetical protein
VKPFRLKRRQRYPEDDLQMVVAEYLDMFLPKEIRWWHVPNGGKRDPREGARFKKMGVKAGVVDNHFLMPDGKLAVIELKIRPNKPTDEQHQFLAAVITTSGMGAVAYSLDEVLTTLNGWFNRYGLFIRMPIKLHDLESRVTATREMGV